MEDRISIPAGADYKTPFLSMFQVTVRAPKLNKLNDTV